MIDQVMIQFLEILYGFFAATPEVVENLLELDCFLLYNDWIVADYNSQRNKTCSGVWRVGAPKINRKLATTLAGDLCCY